MIESVLIRSVCGRGFKSLTSAAVGANSGMRPKAVFTVNQLQTQMQRLQSLRTPMRKDDDRHDPDVLRSQFITKPIDRSAARKTAASSSTAN